MTIKVCMAHSKAGCDQGKIFLLCITPWLFLFYPIKQSDVLPCYPRDTLEASGQS